MSAAALACFRCGYSLHGTPDDGSCPECGLTKRESDRAFAALRGGIDRAKLRLVRNGLLVAYVSWILLMPAAVVAIFVRDLATMCIAGAPLVVHFVAFMVAGDGLDALITEPIGKRSTRERVLRLLRHLRAATTFVALYLLTQYGVPGLVIALLLFGIRMYTLAALDSKLRRALSGLSAVTDVWWWRTVWLGTGVAWALMIATAVAGRFLMLSPAITAVSVLLGGLIDGYAQLLVFRMASRADQFFTAMPTAEILRTARRRYPYDSSAHS
jgi:hypothetical protein